MWDKERLTSEEEGQLHKYCSVSILSPQSALIIIFVNLAPITFFIKFSQVKPKLKRQKWRRDQSDAKQRIESPDRFWPPLLPSTEPEEARGSRQNTKVFIYVLYSKGENWKVSWEIEQNQVVARRGGGGGREGGGTTKRSPLSWHDMNYGLWKSMHAKLLTYLRYRLNFGRNFRKKFFLLKISENFLIRGKEAAIKGVKLCCLN